MNFWIDNAWIISIVAGSSCLTAGLQILDRGPGPTIRSILTLMLALALWAIGYGFALHLPDLPAKLAASTVQMLGIVAIPPTLCMLTLASTGREHLLTLRNVILLHVPALITLALFMSNPVHGLVFSHIRMPLDGQALNLGFGPLFWMLLIGYPLVVSVWCLVQLFQARGKAKGTNRLSLSLIILSLLSPILGIIIYYLVFLPRGGPDPTPVFFLPTALVVSYAVVVRRDEKRDELTQADHDRGEVDFKVQIARSLATLAVPTITYFLLIEITAANVFEIAILAGMLLVTLGGMVFAGFMPSSKITRHYFRIGLGAFTLILGVLGINLLASGGEPGQVLWALIFPMVALLAFGDFWGMVASAALLAVSWLYAESSGHIEQSLLGQFGLRFLVTYCVITFVFLIVDRKRRHFLARTEEQRDALELAMRQWRLTFDAMGDAICLVDADHRIIRCNRAAGENFDRPLQDIPGHFCYQLIHPDEEPGEDCPQRLARETRTRQERILQSGDRWYREVADPILDARGGITGFVHIIGDVTRRKQMEQETERLNRQLAQAQKRESLGIVAGGVAHDFNNLLNGILGYNDLAKQGLHAGSPVREHLDAITGLGMKAAVLTRKMLDYTGHGKRISKTVDLSRLMEEMRIALRASAPGHIGLEFSLTHGLPPARVDTTQLAQAVTNLVVNAAEAIGEADGRITISTGSAVCSLEELRATGFYEDQQPGVYVFVEVADNGPGLDPEILDRIFDPFFTTKFPGRGLGLATISGIIRSHQGAVRVLNTPGKGAAFRLLLPAAGDQ